MIPFRGLPEGSVAPNWTTTAGHARPPLAPRRPSVLAWMREAWDRHRSRSCLCHLNDHMLKDIGVTRSGAEFEAGKRFWQP